MAAATIPMLVAALACCEPGLLCALRVGARAHHTACTHGLRPEGEPQAPCNVQPQPIMGTASALSGHGGLPRAYVFLVMISVDCCCCCHTGHMPAMRPMTKCLGMSCCVHACGAVCATAPGNSRPVRILKTAC
jgi:hypothetical protein